jgi:hypothetical protein
MDEATGLSRKVEVPKRLKPWWWKDEKGKHHHRALWRSYLRNCRR